MHPTFLFSCPWQCVQPRLLHFGLLPVAYIFVFFGLCQLIICLFLSLHHIFPKFIYLWLCSCIMDLIASWYFINPWWCIWLEFLSIMSQYIFWWVFFISHTPFFFLIAFLFSHVIISECILFFIITTPPYLPKIFFWVANSRTTSRGGSRGLFRWVRLLFMPQCVVEWLLLCLTAL